MHIYVLLVFQSQLHCTQEFILRIYGNSQTVSKIEGILSSKILYSKYVDELEFGASDEQKGKYIPKHKWPVREGILGTRGCQRVARKAQSRLASS